MHPSPRLSLVRSLSALAALAVLPVFFSGSARAANTVLTFQNGKTDITNAASYVPATTPSAAYDILFTGAYSPATLTDNTGVTVGTLNDDSATALTITNNSTTANELLTIAGVAGDNNTGTTLAGNVNDVIYVASTANLTFAAAGSSAKTLTINFTTGGNIDNAGTLNIASAVNVTNGKTITFTGAGATTVGGSLAATTGVVIDDATGTVTFSGTNLDTGALTLEGGGILNATNASIQDFSGITIGSTVTGTLASTLQAAAGGLSITKNISLDSTATTAGAIFDENGTASTISGNITGGGDNGLVVANNSTTSAGSLTLSGANTFSKGLSITDTNGKGNTVIDGSSTNTNVFGGAGAVTMGSNTTIDLADNNPTIFELVASSTATNVNVTNASGGITPNTLTLSNTLNFLQTGGSANPVAFFGVISNGTNSGGLGLTLAAGAEILSGDNTYTGGTDINAGILEFAQTDSMPASGTVAVASGGTVGILVAGAAGDFTNATSGAGSIGGIYSGIGGQGAPVTFASGSAVAIDTGSTTQTYAGNITNTGVGLTKVGTGTLDLTGTSTYTGITTISNGDLEVGSAQTSTSGALGDISAAGASGVGAIVFNSPYGGILQYSAANQFDYSPYFSTAASQYINIDENGQNITLSANLVSTGGQFNLYDTAGSGSTTLSGTESYTGVTYVHSGTLILTGTGGFGTSQINGGGTIELDSTTDTNSNGGAPLGTIDFNGGTLESLVPNLTIVNAITLANSGYITGSSSLTVTGVFDATASNKELFNNISGGTLTFSNSSFLIGTAAEAAAALVVIGGSGNTVISGAIASADATYPAAVLKYQGTGMLTLSGANTYTGGTTTASGTVEFQPTDSMPATGTVTVANGSTLAILVDGQSGDFTTGTSGAGTIGGTFGGENAQTASTKVTFATGSALGIDTGSSSQTYSGNIGSANSLNGTATAGVGITKLGTGTLDLSGTNTYTGATTVSAGYLDIEGSLAAGSAVTASGGILEGNGTVNGAVAVTGTGSIMPGTVGTVGTLNTGAVSITNASMTYQLNSSAPTAADSLAITGTLTLNSATLNVSDLSSATLAAGTTFIVASTTTGIVGTFSNYANNTNYMIGNNTYQIQYGTLDPNDVTLEVVAVPEPSTWFLFFAGLGMLGFWQRRKLSLI